MTKDKKMSYGHFMELVASGHLKTDFGRSKQRDYDKLLAILQKMSAHKVVVTHRVIAKLLDIDYDQERTSKYRSVYEKINKWAQTPHPELDGVNLCMKVTREKNKEYMIFPSLELDM